MSPFVFLLIPVVVVVVASLFVYVRGRQPTGLHSGIDGFQREMNAISPDAGEGKPRRFDSGPVTRPVRPVGPAEPAHGSTGPGKPVPTDRPASTRRGDD